MSAKNTVVLFVHGANQGKKNKEENTAKWEKAFNATKHSKAVRQLISGEYNKEIERYHKEEHPGQDYPQYVNWTAPWYGGVWASLDQFNPFGKRLNKNDERTSKIERIERSKMKKHFDELVPFYELAVVNNDGRTLYEMICQEFLEQLIKATTNDQCYILIAHSMGCAVTYNVMSHISCAQNNINYCPIDGTLSQEYRQAISTLANGSSKCFGLLMFGNYTGFNWCQRLNNRILFGEFKEQFVYPKSVRRWFNFWTFSIVPDVGGDPYILDDKLGKTIVGDDEGRYDDVRVVSNKIGHSFVIWFKRKRFAKKIWKKIAYQLYG